ncbi:hypothetical protein [Phenylobacterium sp.]|uniref:hypothetical protein n=1 Tax=Phenylobacterium sp. TaxID=1871053 RepID=UPI002B8D4666|nr:hypothetical protein [Phenylobacterium sp.]HVI33129.1 hypothetical protein [Phenylobacterium sp.]
MNQFSASEAALEGFRLTRERPGTILAWAGVYFLGIMAIALLMVLALGPQFAEVMQRGQLTPEDTDLVAGMLADSWPAFLLVLLVVATLMSVLMAGIYRLVLRPEEPGLAHLRLGADEFRLTAVNLALFPIGFICLFAAIIAVTYLRETGSPLGIILLLAVVALTAWLGARLSMVTPMTFASRKIAFGPAWKLTRGRMWPLLGMMVLAAIFYLMIWLLLSIIGVAIVAIAGGSQAIEAGELTPGAVIGGLLTLVMQFLLSVLQIVMIYAPFAVAYQQITGQTATHR